MLIETNFCGIDEISFGIFMAYGDDDNGDFHITTLGFIFFEIVMINYINSDDSDDNRYAT